MGPRARGGSELQRSEDDGGLDMGGIKRRTKLRQFRLAQLAAGGHPDAEA